MRTTFYTKFRRHKPSRREPLASPASHRRSPKRLLHLFKQKSPHAWETPLASKRSSSTPSDSSDSSGDGVVVYSDTGYPRIDGDHQVVTADSEPSILRFLGRITQKLKLELDLDSYDGHKTHGSSQKRQADNPDQGSREEKKQKQGRGSRNTGDGGGDENKNGRRNGRKQPPDGHRYPVPPPHSGPQNKPPFACPFHKFDPVRYDRCSKVRLKRPSDVSQHINRSHTLKDVKQETANAEDAEPADNVEHVGNAEDEEQVALYCTKCRMEFYGTTAEANLRQHLPCQTPHSATIEQTGMLLPAEFVQLNAARTEATGDIPKWNAMWKTCFPNKPVPKSPYFALPGQEAMTVLPEVEVETLVPRSQAGEIIRRVLNGCPSHFLFMEGEIDTIVNQALNGLYSGSSGAESQTSTDTPLERQKPQQQMSQQQISQQSFNGAATSTAFEPSAFPTAPPDYPPSHRLYQNPSASAPFAPTPRVMPQTVPPPGPQTNAQTQNFPYGAAFDDAIAFALPPQHSPQMSPPAADIETGLPVPFRSAPEPVPSETSPASQARNNSSVYAFNDSGFDGTGFPMPNQSGADVSGFPSLQGNGFPMNNGMNDDGFPWWSHNGNQDPDRRYWS